MERVVPVPTENRTPAPNMPEAPKRRKLEFYEDRRAAQDAATIALQEQTRLAEQEAQRQLEEAMRAHNRANEELAAPRKRLAWYGDDTRERTSPTRDTPGREKLEFFKPNRPPHERDHGGMDFDR